MSAARFTLSVERTDEAISIAIVLPAGAIENSGEWGDRFFKAMLRAQESPAYLERLAERLKRAFDYDGPRGTH